MFLPVRPSVVQAHNTLQRYSVAYGTYGKLRIVQKGKKVDLDVVPGGEICKIEAMLHDKKLLPSHALLA